MTRILESLSDLGAQYDAVFCDLWGCLHNGIAPFPEAVTALETFVQGGGIVILLTNSPRPSAGVREQLDRMGVSRALYHQIASSGDAALAALAGGGFGRKVWHLGPARDETFFDAYASQYPDRPVTRVPLEEAEGIVCTGLVNDATETPEDYRAQLLYARTKGLPFLCANPDIFVDHGDTRIYCAGALAEAYAADGGMARAFGKPHPPIYDLARDRLQVLAGRKMRDDRILCIGDGILTDIAGGVGEDLDTLFITGGLAREETGTDRQPDPARLRAFLETASLSPTYAMGMLR